MFNNFLKTAEQKENDMWLRERQLLIEEYCTDNKDFDNFMVLLNNQYKERHFIHHEALLPFNLCKLTAMVLHRLTMKDIISIQATDNDLGAHAYVKSDNPMVPSVLSTSLMHSRLSPLYSPTQHKLYQNLHGLDAGTDGTLKLIANIIGEDIDQMMYQYIARSCADSSKDTISKFVSPAQLVLKIAKECKTIGNQYSSKWAIVSLKTYQKILKFITKQPDAAQDMKSVYHCGQLHIPVDNPIQIYVNYASDDTNRITLGHKPNATEGANFAFLPYTLADSDGHLDDGDTYLKCVYGTLVCGNPSSEFANLYIK